VIKQLVFNIGYGFMNVAQQVGGISIMMVRILSRLFPPQLDLPELKRSLYKMGVQSLPIVIVTSILTGAIGVIQAAYIVKRYNAYSMVGAGAGFVVVRELGPILISLMFSGRVGSNNTAELGTMVVTEQIDALRALAIDPVKYLLLPRSLAMVFCMLVLVMYGDFCALASGALMSKLMLGVDFRLYYQGLTEWVRLWDFATGVIKSVFFGAVIAMSSCYYGISVTGGAPGVGRAVNAAVVASAAGIFVLDFFVTNALGD
jgi:phospholipid/cholesterol/gamma-HCH transport system permease protein